MLPEPKQIWECPVCGRQIPAPIPYNSVICTALHNGKYTEIAMVLISGYTREVIVKTNKRNKGWDSIRKRLEKV